MTLSLPTPLVSGGHAPPLSPRLAQPPRHSHALRVLLLLLALAMLNGVDLLYTVAANHIQPQLFDEMNPLAELFLRQGMIRSLIGFKVLLALGGLGMLWKLRSSRLTLPACWGLLFAYAYLGVIWYQWVCVVNDTLEVRMSVAAQ